MKRLNSSLQIFKILCIATALLFTSLIVEAKENIGIKPANNPQLILMKMGSGCASATAQRALDVNNVRTTILNGGDMWWNLSNAKYEIPKVLPGQVSKNSLFSGALWIGGVTNNNIRIAAQTYRQNGNDYYPGPLTNATASINADACKKYDKIWSIKLTDLDNFRNNSNNFSNPSDDIATWPCEGDVTQGQAPLLAPFVDFNNNKKYEPYLGEYPSFEQNVTVNIPDQMMFMIYNDKGNIHSETQGVPIGLELQTQCFAFSTNNEINNMTFYRTKVINRSTEKIDSCIFGQWVDPDLGNYSDDYVECDVTRNLGICYNGDDNDEGILGYGLNPPSIGVNFFQGPKDSKGKEIGLTKFVYYNNDFSQQGNPQRPEHYWGYLNGRWKDATPITYGGNGHGGSDTASFMFPGTTDPAIPKRAEWTERIAGNTPGDRRFLQTAGPFSLLPGAVNTITIGVVWARATTGGATGSFNLLKQASDKAYALFKNNFALITGPPAPKMSIVELNNQLLFTIIPDTTVENFVTSFAGQGVCETRTTYRFQGYQVFQVKLPNIPGDVYDPSQAQLIAQFDINDSVSKVVNKYFDPDLGVYVSKRMVSGANTGIQHSFLINKDFFQSGSNQGLINFQNYNYFILAYSVATTCINDPLQYLESSKTINEDAIHIYTVTPHDPAPRGNGTQINSNFGDGIPVTQYEGVGNGGYSIQLSQQSINQALSSNSLYKSNPRTYLQGSSPVYVKVIDPLSVRAADFVLFMKDSSKSVKKDSALTASQTTWYLRNLTTGETKAAERTIDNQYEQLFPQWGLSININQSISPGDANSLVDLSNGYISSSMVFADDKSKPWLIGVSDEDANYAPYNITNQLNWIRAGLAGKDLSPPFSNAQTSDFGTTSGALDPRKNYGKMINATWSPYALAARFQQVAGSLGSNGPGWSQQPGGTTDNPISDLQSVQVVLTSDKSKWSRCIVLETGEDKNINVGGADKMDVRLAKSVDKNGRTTDNGGLSGATNVDAADYISPTGMGWFPGYAINVETGERLNILFGEDSSLPSENGQDMLWNPTENVASYNRGGSPIFGGKHFIYVMGVKKFSLSNGSIKYTPTRYDACKNYSALMGDLLNQSDANGNLSAPLAYITRKRVFYSQALYTSIPTVSNSTVLKSVYDGIIPSDVTISINVKRPYASYQLGGYKDLSGQLTPPDTATNHGLPYYTFSTKGFAAQTNEQFAKKALDIVNIVPNPYYAFSTYEDPGNALDTRIKITNLPKRCTINIYSIDGVLVRSIKRDDGTKTYEEWDLKNDAKVPIVSGIYLIHIYATDLGEERMLKWYGVMRPADYDSF